MQTNDLRGWISLGIKHARAWTALALSLLTTLAIAIITFVLAWLYKTLIEWWSQRLEWKHPVQIAPALYGHILFRTFYRPVCGLKNMSLDRSICKIEEDDIVLVIANHFSDLGLAPLAMALQLTFGWRWTWVIRTNVNPVLRWPLNALGCILTIDRDDRSQAISAMQEQAPMLAKKSQVFVIHPDESRPNQGPITKDKERYQQKLDMPLPWLEHTKFYKAGGVRQMYAMLTSTGRHVRVVHMISGLNRPNENIWDAPKIVGATYHALSQEVSQDDIPNVEDEEAWKALMQELCKNANQKLDFWRTHRKIRKKQWKAY